MPPVRCDMPPRTSPAKSARRLGRLGRPVPATGSGCVRSTHDDVIEATDELRSDVVAVRREPGNGDGPQAAVAEPDRHNDRVGIEATIKGALFAVRPLDVDGLDLGARQPPDQVEIMDRGVSEESGPVRSWRCRLGAMQPHQVKPAQAAARNERPSRCIGRVKPPLKTNLHGNSGRLDVVCNVNRSSQVGGKRLLAQVRTAAVHGGFRKLGMGVRRRRDGRRIGAFEGNDRIGDNLCVDLATNRSRSLWVEIGDQQRVDLGHLTQELRVKKTHPADPKNSDLHRTSSLVGEDRRLYL